MTIYPYTDTEWDNLPHVILTADTDWDPTVISEIIFITGRLCLSRREKQKGFRACNAKNVELSMIRQKF